MASENLNRWAGTYDLQKTQLWRLESCSVYMFLTKEVVHSGPGGNEDMLGRLPLYHVWVDDKEVYCGPEIDFAYMKYRNALMEGLYKSAT